MPSTRSRLVATGTGVAAAVAYGISRWPNLTSWGATEDEVHAAMPGDDLVGRARYRSTHAVAVEAPCHLVWPWLVQLGQGRGGLYSYDWLENLLGLDIHSATTIDPDLQLLAAGDVVRLVPEGTQPPLRFAVARIEAPFVLVLGPGEDRATALAEHLPVASWTFQLTPNGAGACRLVVRFQADFAPTPLAYVAYKYALAPIHLVMERKMMLGLKQRAECSVSPAPHLTVLPS